MNANKEQASYVKLILWCFIIVGILVIFETIMEPALPNNMMDSRVWQMDSYINDVFPKITANNDHAIGIYILGRYVGKTLHLGGGVETFRFLSRVMIYLSILLFPILILRLFHNRAAAYASPVLLCLFFYDFFITNYRDTYIVIGICSIILAIPLILMLDCCPKGNARISIYIKLTVIMSFSNIARAHTSLGLLIILICLVISDIVKSVKEKKQSESLKYIIFLFIMLSVYNLFASIIPNILLVLLGQEKGHSSATAWHNIYIGFGFLDNPYNIIYSDSCIADKVKELYPDIIYLSDEYFAVCKHLVFELLLSDPFFCIKNVLIKTICTPVYIVFDTIRGIPRGVCIGGTALYWLRTRRKNSIFIKKKWIFFWCILFVTGITPSILTIPSVSYSITAYASFQMLFIMLILYFISNTTRTKPSFDFRREILK